MRWRLYIAVVPAIVIIALVGAWISAPWWLARLAESQLSERGFTVQALAIDTVGWQESRLERLHFRQASSGLELDIHGLVASYRISQLLDRQLDGLAIDKLQIRVHRLSREPQAIELVLFSPARLVAAIPIGRIQISDMLIQRLDEGQKVLQELVGQAGLVDKSVSVELHEPQAPEGLKASMSLDATGALLARLQRGEDEIIRASSLIKENGERLSADGDLHADLALLDSVAGDWVEMPEHRLQGSFDAHWQASLPSNQDIKDIYLQSLLEVSASVALDAEWAMPVDDESRRVMINAEIGYGREAGSWKLASGSRLLLGRGKQQTKIVPVALAGRFRRQSGGWQVVVDSSAQLAIDNLKLDDTAISGAGVNLSQPMKIFLPSDAPIQLQQATVFSISMPKLQLGSSRLDTEDIRITLKEGLLESPAGTFEVRGMKLATATVKLPTGTLNGHFDFSQERVTATGTLAGRDGKIRLDWKLVHYLAGKSHGELNYTLKPVTFGPAGIDLARLFEGQDEYALQGGRLSAEGRQTWSDSGNGQGLRLLNRLSLDLADVKGFYKSNTFSGLNGNLQIRINDAVVNMAPGDISIAELDAGIPIRNVSMNAAVKYPLGGSAKMIITRLNGEVLGGYITSDRIDIDLARDSNPFVVRLKRLDARQIAAIYEQEGLSAKGIVDGTLPFDWTRDGLRLVRGRLVARSPGGIIRYLRTESGRALATTDRSMKMVLDILSDLHFNHLVIGVDSQPDGETMLHIELKGYNPGYEKGRPVEFNLNIEENVLKLLYSLNMADDIGGRLEKKLQTIIQKK